MKLWNNTVEGMNKSAICQKLPFVNMWLQAATEFIGYFDGAIRDLRYALCLQNWTSPKNGVVSNQSNKAIQNVEDRYIHILKRNSRRQITCLM